MYGVAKDALRIAIIGVILLSTACTSPAKREAQEPAVVESPAPTWARASEGVATRQTKAAPKPSTPKAPEKMSVLVLEAADAEEAMIRHRQALLSGSEAPLEGSEIGYYVDVLEARLIQLSRETEINIVRSGNRISLHLPGTEVFESNRTAVRKGAREALDALAAVLEEYQKSLISIRGYTDDLGEADYNLQLSERRALSVARLLIKAGVGRERITVVGYGESRPIASNTTEEGRAANRRIEFVLEPLAI